MADTKKVRSIEERKEAMLAELAELEAKQLDRYRKELTAKVERRAKAEEQRAKYAAEVEAIDVRIVGLTELIAELEDDGSDETEADETYVSTPLEVVTA